jgi:hypothetical protein
MRLPGLSAIEISLDQRDVNFQSGRTTVDHSADSSAV